MYSKVATDMNFAAREKEVLSFWREHDIVKKKLKVPPTYMMPVFIGLGYPDPDEPELEQSYPDVDSQLHFGRWR